MVASFSEFDHSKTSFKIGGCVAAACNHSKMQCSRTTFLSPVGANLGKISSHGDNLSAQDVCESPHSSKISSNGSSCRAQNAFKGEHSSNAGSKFNAYHVGENLSSHSGDLSSQNCSGGSDSFSAAQSGDHSENPSKMSCNLGYGSDSASKKKNSYVGEKVSLCSGNAQDGCGNVGAVQQHGYGGENPRKLSSSGGNFAAYGSDNSGNLSGSVCASDNSSNYVRWSSTSCTSDTTSGSSTRRSSWESRTCSSGAAPACAIKPHKANDVAWAAIRSLQLREGGAPLGIAHFKLLRRVGHGDIGSVFLTQLRDSYPTPTNGACFFAIKVMDKEALTQRDKLQRMHMEKEILECVDHPFLPTLYAHFDTEQFSCLVMEFCPGGDLYALRQKQLGKRFSLVAARFYAAEVLLALEYLHMLGIVYRDLKPENVLVREDGHIMLTDFDLSLKSEVKPQLLKYPSSSPSSLTSSSSTKSRLLRSFSQSSTVSSSSTTSFLHHSSANCMLPAACSIHPIISCLSLSNNKGRKVQQTQKQQQKQQPACELGMKSSKVSNARLPSKTSSNKDRSDSGHLDISKHDMSQTLSNTSRHDDDDDAQRAANMSTKLSKYNTTDTANSGGSNGAQRTSTSGSACREDDMMYMELVAEPTQARSMSFVGTHEYLAPEIIAGYGHGSPVDWWTFGIFLFELLFGRTPFKGASNDQTLINIIRQHLRFPEWTEFEAGEDAKSLIQGLLMKDPRKRLGFTKGAAEIKQHPFFKGINWALIRCAKPPEVPTNPNKKVMNLSSKHNHNHDYHHGSHHHDITTKVLNINRTVSRSLPHFDYF